MSEYSFAYEKAVKIGNYALSHREEGLRFHNITSALAFHLMPLNTNSLSSPAIYAHLAGSIIFFLPQSSSLQVQKGIGFQSEICMNIYFSKVIKAGERQREFNFRKLSNADDSSYYVDVNDDKGNRIIFSMYRDAEGKWKTSAQKLPLWIHNAEDILGEVIETYIKEEKAIK